MATKKVEIYVCDLCKAKSLQPFSYGQRDLKTEISIVQDYREGPGPKVILRDLCDDCDTKARTIAAYVLKELVP